MTKVAILPVTTDQGNRSYHAIAGAKQSSGATAGAALDALTAQLSADETSTLIIVQSLRPDQLESLIEAELQAATQRAAALADDVGL
jgi:hypothetical protein